MKTKYQALVAAGKPPKVASAAVMRKLIILELLPIVGPVGWTLPKRVGQVGPYVPDRFSSVIGGLLPIALCGRNSL